MLQSITFVKSIAKLKNRYKLDLNKILNLVELLVVLVTIPLSFLITKGVFLLTDYSWDLNFVQSLAYGFFFIFLWFIMSHLTSMAMLPRAQRYVSAALLFFRGFFFIFIVLYLMKLALNLQAIPFTFLFVHVHVAFLLTLGLRLFTMHILRTYRATGYNLRHVVVIGDACAHPTLKRFLNQKDWGFDIRAIISQSAFIKRKYGKDVPILPGIENIDYILESQVVDEVIYCKKNVDQAELRKLVQTTNEVGVVLRVQSASPDALAPERVQLKTVNEVGKLALVDIPSRNLSHDVKTVTDIFFSTIALLLLSPFLLVIAGLIKITSPGPIFFKQERIGLRGRKFKLYKFRTMVVNAEKLLEKLKEQNEMDGPTFKLTDDPRITKIGKFLRKTGLDELPQFYNVAKGEMSLIGPRPPLEAEVRQYERWQLRRLSVKPGISCTWQIMPHRNDIKFDKWMRMDLNYIDNWTLAKDVRLIFKTISSMLFATGR